MKFLFHIGPSPMERAFESSRLYNGGKEYIGARQEYDFPIHLDMLPFYTPPVPGAWRYDGMISLEKGQKGVFRRNMTGDKIFGWRTVTFTRDGWVELNTGDWLTEDGEFFKIHKNLLKR